MLTAWQLGPKRSAGGLAEEVLPVVIDPRLWRRALVLLHCQVDAQRQVVCSDPAQVGHHGREQHDIHSHLARSRRRWSAHWSLYVFIVTHESPCVTYAINRARIAHYAIVCAPLRIVNRQSVNVHLACMQVVTHEITCRVNVHFMLMHTSLIMLAMRLCIFTSANAHALLPLMRDALYAYPRKSLMYLMCPILPPSA